MCCGFNDYRDWENTAFGKDSKDVPDSCCKTPFDGCGKGVLALPDPIAVVHTAGCYYPMRSYVQSVVKNAIGVVFFVVGHLLGSLCIIGCRGHKFTKSQEGDQKVSIFKISY
jgi:hypothetical protein